jgi:transmembrane sensor
LVAQKEFTTQRGQRADLRLSDGTHVVLAADSRLTVPADFDKTRREVTLEGEGYFEVVHNTQKPFRVRAQHGIVHDIGTKFDVRAYPTDRTVRVVVTEGRVAVRAAATSVATANISEPILRAGELGELDSAGVTKVTPHVDSQRYVSWTEGKLVFDATTLGEAAPQLARWYDLDIHLAGAGLSQRRLTITLDQESVAQVLDAIARVTNARYTLSGRRVVFTAVSER